ncbi:TfoX/Sxy family protein [Rudaea sp.]|uniref:TfoX/Sxy family protein n=1 Tax=Rudaea sp. TaxID=2136325 RepID=UPI002ECFF0AB
MTRDAGLEELIDGELEGVHGLSNKAMFGGWAWLLNGNLLFGARDAGLLVRLGKDRDDWALRVPGIERAVMRGRAMHGWVRVSPETCGDDALRGRLVRAALAFVGSLPPKR